jgi:hypothetical protein
MRRWEGGELLGVVGEVGWGGVVVLVAGAGVGSWEEGGRGG